MWRRVLYVMCTVEAALLAAVLVVVVVEPQMVGLTVTPRVRQLCAFGALVLMIGCGYTALCWLGGVIALGRERLTR